MTIARFPTVVATLAILVSASSFADMADPSKSTVSAVFKQMGVPVEARFKKFAASVDFDPAHPTSGRAQVDVEVSSIDLGDPEYNQEVGKPEWFDAAHFPKATFVTSAIKQISTGQLEASGKLTIKGKSQDLVVPINYKQEGALQVFDGTVKIKRLAYNIGEGEWKDTSTLADEVTIKFHTAVPSKK